MRPRFGVMRSREFLMKDAYSFHTFRNSLQETYDAMYAALQQNLQPHGLDFRAVQADTGSIGGSALTNFRCLAQSGEDDVVSPILLTMQRTLNWQKLSRRKNRALLLPRNDAG